MHKIIRDWLPYCPHDYFLSRVLQSYKNLMIAEGLQFKGHKAGWQLHFQLREECVLLEIHSEVSMATYEGQMTSQHIQEDKNFSFFFETPRDLFKFLETSYNELTILPDGTLLFAMDMPIGRTSKKIEFRIPTVKRELDQALIVERRFKNLEKTIEGLRLEQQELVAKAAGQSESVGALREEVAGLQRALAQKDQVLNSIFSQLEELSKWREERERRGEAAAAGRRRFVPDEQNSHNVKFVGQGGRYRKTCGGSWDLLICKHEIERNDLYRYSLRQVRAGNNGSFMYGIATAAVRGVTRAQDHKEFIGYYENTGNIYDRGESKKGGAKIKDGDTLTIEVDTRGWKIAWFLEGNKEAECPIVAELKVKPIFLAIVVYNEDSEVEFL